MRVPLRLLVTVLSLGFATVAAVPAAAAAPARATAPPPHVMVVLMENHGAGAIIGNPRAPFENSLAHLDITLTDWSGVDHPSSPNYVALITGQDNGHGGRNDCMPTYPRLTPCDVPGDNLGVQLATAGIPAAWFAEDLAGNGCSIPNAESGRNDVNHEPWAYLPAWQADPRACGQAGLTTRSPTDPEVLASLRSSHAPDFVWLTPNLADDTHDGSIAHGDAYLRSLVGSVRRTAWYRAGGTIVITYDEDEGEANPPGYCRDPVVFTRRVGRHCIPTFVVSAADAGIGAVATPGDHFGLLRSIEEVYHLPLLDHAADPGFGDIARYLVPGATH